MPRCLISFGANIGDALGTIEQAAQALSLRLGCGAGQFQLSRYYNTPPIGGPTGQPPFVNAVAAVATELSPWQVWQAVRDVEQQFGRQRCKRWEARRIDLDILLFDDVRIWTAQLKIPHPRMCMRRFILEPAMEVAADWIDPVSNLSVGALGQALRGGKGNLVLCANHSARPEVLLEEVARQTLADWRVTQQQHGHFSILDSQPPTTSTAADSMAALPLTGTARLEARPGVGDRASSQVAVPTPHSRWVACLPAERLAEVEGKIRLEPPPKLLVFLADESEETGSQWEDVHRQLARRLQLTDDPRPASGWQADGTKYLLATDNRAWAIHELVAALEAMDCPVELLR